MIKLDKAREFLVKLPSWVMIIDKDHNIIARNSIADSVGLSGKKKCFGLGNRKKPCSWCVTKDAFKGNKDLSANVRVNLDSEEWAKPAEKGGFNFDAHLVHIDDSEYLLHFGFIGLLPKEKREEALDLIKSYLGEVPKQISENIQATVDELSKNEINPMDPNV